MTLAHACAVARESSVGRQGKAEAFLRPAQLGLGRRRPQLSREEVPVVSMVAAVARKVGVLDAPTRPSRISDQTWRASPILWRTQEDDIFSITLRAVAAEINERFAAVFVALIEVAQPSVPTAMNTTGGRLQASQETEHPGPRCAARPADACLAAPCESTQLHAIP